MVATLQLPGPSGPMRVWSLEVSMTPTLVSFMCETPTVVWYNYCFKYFSAFVN